MCQGEHPYIPVADTALVRLIFTQFGSVLMNVVHFEKSGGWTQEGLDDLLDQVDISWNARWKAQMPTTVTLTKIQAVDLTTQNGAFAEKSINVAGTLVGAALPNSVTTSFKFATAQRGRSFRGRLYWIGLTEPNVVGDAIDATFLGTLLGQVKNFFGDVAAATTSQHVIVSYCANLVWRAIGVTTPVTAYSNDGVVDAQRRRLAGRGV